MLHGIRWHTLFYYKFIAQDASGDEQWWSHNFESRLVSTWQRLAFEIVCLMHTDCIKKALGISGMATEVSSWRKVADENQRGGQIDLVITFVTTYGVADSLHHSIVHSEVTMEDLFAMRE